jgi:thiol-disulfide isomerase/thioredoxin
MNSFSTRSLLCSSVLAVSIGLCGNAASAATPSEKADMAWNHLERYVEAASGLSQLSPEVPRNGGYLPVWESFTRVVRRYGLKFYDNHPDDPRRLKWLPIAFNHQPRYWLDPVEGAKLYEAARKSPDQAPPIPLDEAAKAEWEKRYPQLRAEFLASPHITETERAHLLVYEMRRRIFEQTRDADRSVLFATTDEGRRFRAQLEQEIVDVGNMHAEWQPLDRVENLLDLNANSLLDAYWLTGDGQAANRYIARLGTIRNATLRKFAEGKVRIMNLTQKPMEGRFVTLEGEEMDFEELRGKVVLIQYWATDCAGCIGQMPKLKKLYAKYHAQGFEVIGYVFHQLDMKKNVAEFAAKRELPWQHRLDPKLREDYDRYSFTWVSNLLLLDKEGKLVMHSHSPSEAQLDALISRELGTTAKL